MQLTIPPDWQQSFSSGKQELHLAFAAAIADETFEAVPGYHGTTIIQDAYANIHYWHAFQVEAGRFKQPFSYEQLI